jgi:hypothetical protein
MNKLPGITFLIWGVFLLGCWLLPGLFKQDAIQFFLTVLFSVLLPVSFWQLAMQRKRKYLSLFFIGIFIVNVSFLGMIIRSNIHMHQQITAQVEQGIEQKLAEYTVTAVTGKKRRIAARLIYQQYGVVLPYKNEAGSYLLYVPNQDDKKEFQGNFFAANDLKIKRSEFAASVFTALVLLIIHVGLFLGLLIFLVLYDKGKGR